MNKESEEISGELDNDEKEESEGISESDFPEVAVDEPLDSNRTFGYITDRERRDAET